MLLASSLVESTIAPFVGIAAVLLVYPQDRLPSRRWRWGVIAVSVGTIVEVAELIGILDDEDNLGWLAYLTLFLPVIVASAVRVINDYRRAVGDIRRQLKWFAWVLLVGGLLMLLSIVPLRLFAYSPHVAAAVLSVGAPVAIGVAVTKYRLYEIDRIMSRTVTYAMVVGVLGVVYAVGAVWLPTRAAGDRSSLFVAGSTLAVFALFNPVRRRVQGAVDRRFNRSRYDAGRVIGAFAASLRDEVDPDEVVEGWVGVVSETMQPVSVGVWVREADR